MDAVSLIPSCQGSYCCLEGGTEAPGWLSAHTEVGLSSLIQAHFSPTSLQTSFKFVPFFSSTSGSLLEMRCQFNSVFSAESVSFSWSFYNSMATSWFLLLSGLLIDPHYNLTVQHSGSNNRPPETDAKSSKLFLWSPLHCSWSFFLDIPHTSILVKGICLLG